MNLPLLVAHVVSMNIFVMASTLLSVTVIPLVTVVEAV
jgi:hypothetical protein